MAQAMEYNLCFICSDPIKRFFEFTRDERTSAGMLCDLLKLPLTHKTMTFGSRFPHVPFCPRCVTEMKGFDEMLRSFMELEGRISQFKGQVENKLRESCQRRRESAGSNEQTKQSPVDTTKSDELHPIDFFREAVVNELKPSAGCQSSSSSIPITTSNQSTPIPIQSSTTRPSLFRSEEVELPTPMAFIKSEPDFSENGIREGTDNYNNPPYTIVPDELHEGDHVRSDPFGGIAEQSHSQHVDNSEHEVPFDERSILGYTTTDDHEQESFVITPQPIQYQGSHLPRSSSKTKVRQLYSRISLSSSGSAIIRKRARAGRVCAGVFRCGECEAKFNSPLLLREHKVKECGRRWPNTLLPVACPVCGKYYTKNCNMYRHLRDSHKVEPPIEEGNRRRKPGSGVQ